MTNSSSTQLPDYGTTVYMNTLDVFGKAVGLIGDWFAIDIGTRHYQMVPPSELFLTNTGWEWCPTW